MTKGVYQEDIIRHILPILKENDIRFKQECTIGYIDDYLCRIDIFLVDANIGIEVKSSRKGRDSYTKIHNQIGKYKLLIDEVWLVSTKSKSIYSYNADKIIHYLNFHSTIPYIRNKILDYENPVC